MVVRRADVAVVRNCRPGLHVMMNPADVRRIEFALRERRVVVVLESMPNRIRL